jgi:hypothetical protein
MEYFKYCNRKDLNVYRFVKINDSSSVPYIIGPAFCGT